MKCINNITAKQLAILANAVSLGIADGKSVDDIVIISTFISAVGSNLGLIAAQQANLDSIAEKKKQLEELKKQVADLEKDLI